MTPDNARMNWGRTDGQSRPGYQMVNVGESFTIPDAVTAKSPTGDPKFDAQRPTVGGDIVDAFSDQAQAARTNAGKLANWEPLQMRLNRGDKVSVGAVAGGKAPVTVTPAEPPGAAAIKVFDIPCTAVAGVILAWG